MASRHAVNGRLEELEKVGEGEESLMPINSLPQLCPDFAEDSGVCDLLRRPGLPCHRGGGIVVWDADSERRNDEAESRLFESAGEMDGLPLPAPAALLRALQCEGGREGGQLSLHAQRTSWLLRRRRLG